MTRGIEQASKLGKKSKGKTPFVQASKFDKKSKGKT